MENTSKLMGAVITILTVVLMISVLPTDRDAALYTDTVRLHILANSDSTEDQELKLEIRDKLLLKYGAELSTVESADEAGARLEEMIPKMSADVDLWLTEAGYDYTSLITIDEEWYERRSYGEISIPEGYYTSLKVELGAADGQNWWCVMYPPLCLDIATEGADRDDAILGYGTQAGALISSGKYTVKFRALELASELVSFFGRK